MKNFILSTLLIFGVVALFAQNSPSFKWTDLSNREEKKTWDRQLIGSDASEIIFAEEKLTLGKALKLSYGIESVPDYEVVRYDKKSLKQLSREPLELKHKKEKLSLHGVKEMKGDKTWIFSTFTNKDKKKVYLFAQSFDVSSKTLKSDRVKIAERPYSKSFIFSTSEMSLNFDIYFSPDRSKLLIVNFKNVKKKEKVKIAVAVYDQDMNKLWTKKIALPSTRKKTSLSEIGVDNDGNVFFGASIANEKKGKRSEIDYKQKVYIYTNNGADRSLKTIKLGKEQWLANGGTIWPVKNGKLLYLVSYSNGRKSGDTEFLVARIDVKTGKIEQTKKYKFPIEWVSGGKSDYAMDAIKKDIVKKRFKFHKNLNARSMIYDLSTGSATVFLEEYEEVAHGGHAKSGGGFTRESYTYKYAEVIVIHIDKDGELVWQNSVNKKQESASKRYLSFLPIKNQGEIYLLFNDSKRNIEKRAENESLSTSDIRKPKEKKFDQVLVTFDREGKMTEKVIKTTPFTLIYPRNYYKLSDDEFVIFGKNKSTRSMGLMTF